MYKDTCIMNIPHYFLGFPLKSIKGKNNSKKEKSRRENFYKRVTS